MYSSRDSIHLASSTEHPSTNSIPYASLLSPIFLCTQTIRDSVDRCFRILVLPALSIMAKISNKERVYFNRY